MFHLCLLRVLILSEAIILLSYSRIEGWPRIIFEARNLTAKKINVLSCNNRMCLSILSIAREERMELHLEDDLSILPVAPQTAIKREAESTLSRFDMAYDE